MKRWDARTLSSIAVSRLPWPQWPLIRVARRARRRWTRRLDRNKNGRRHPET